MTEEKKYTEKDVHLAWLAGFMEGDDGYQIAVKPNQLRISASQSVKNKLNLDAMQMILDECDVYYKRYNFKNRKHP